MSGMQRGDRSGTSLEELLPWYLNGTLDEAETALVRAALAKDPELRARLAELAWAGDLFAARPDSATLIEHAKGGLDPDAAAAVDEYLEEAREDRELLALAALGLQADQLTESADADLAPERTERRGARVARPGLSPWLAAAAASLVAGVALWGWFSASRGGPGGTSAPVTPARVLELSPSDLVLRGEPAPEPTVLEATGGPRVLVLVTEALGTYDHFRLELESAAGDTVWRSEPLQPDVAGTFVVLLDPARIPSGTAELVLLGVTDGTARPVHRYALQIQSR